MTRGLPAGRVRLAEDHVAWAAAFARESARIRHTLGSRVLAIEHVGSTALPGVPAKPILDLLWAVASFEWAAACIAPLVALGCRYRGENGIPRRHYFVKGSPRTHHLHTVERDSPTWRDTLHFRDLLRSQPAAAAAYARAKRDLARRHRRHRAAYQRERGRWIDKLLGLTPPSAP